MVTFQISAIALSLWLIGLCAMVLWEEKKGETHGTSQAQKGFRHQEQETPFC